MTLQAALKGGACQVGYAGLMGIEAIVQRRQSMFSKATTTASSSMVKTLEPTSLGAIATSLTLSWLRYLATVFGLFSYFSLRSEIEAFDLCIAALIAYVVVALPCNICPIAPRGCDGKILNHHTPGLSLYEASSSISYHSFSSWNHTPSISMSRSTSPFGAVTLYDPSWFATNMYSDEWPS